MYKKLIGATVVAAMAMAVYFTTDVEANDDNKVDLASLLKVNNANAECFPFNGFEGICLGVGASVTCQTWRSFDCDGTQP